MLTLSLSLLLSFMQCNLNRLTGSITGWIFKAYIKTPYRKMFEREVRETDRPIDKQRCSDGKRVNAKMSGKLQIEWNENKIKMRKRKIGRRLALFGFGGALCLQLGVMLLVKCSICVRCCCCLFIAVFATSMLLLFAPTWSATLLLLCTNTHCVFLPVYVCI